MLRILRVALGLLVITPSLVCAQTGEKGNAEAAGREAGRKSGAIYKDDIDTLIAVLRSTSRQGTAAAKAAVPAPGVLGDSVLSTSKILVAMGYCHRRYNAGDGPVVRPSLDYLIANRQADGTFGDQASTLWAADALRLMDGATYREEIAAALAAVGAEGKAASGFEQRVTKVLDQVRADVWPQQLGEKFAAVAQACWKAPATIDRAVAADTLVQLVACEVANRRLDKMAAQQSGAVTFTASQQKAFTWLLTQQKDGIFAMRSIPSVDFTAFGVLALQSKPKAMRTKEEQGIIDQGLAWLASQQNPDGTFGDRTPNYSTCVSVAALAHSGNPAFKPLLDKAQHAILGFQNLEASGYQRGDRDYGSIGYGDDERGDLSNTQFALQALRDAGLPEDHEAFRKALVFLERSQNLKSVNHFEGKVPDPEREGAMLDATSGDDGGASYYPGNSNAGYIVQPDGKTIARSYGSMTYALLKSYTLAGLKADDPRVVAAVKWISTNWTLAINPGADPALGEKAQFQGLFYYYMVLSQALDLVGLDKVNAVSTDAKGVSTSTEVDWRAALRAKLESMQGPDGAWLNDKNGRWYESLPLLCTCYAMVALEHCR